MKHKYVYIYSNEYNIQIHTHAHKQLYQWCIRSFLFSSILECFNCSITIPFNVTADVQLKNIVLVYLYFLTS